MDRTTRGLFITGTDTGVGKTYVAGLIAKCLRKAGRRVGVYKPAASGCRRTPKGLISDDALALWESAGRPGTLDRVCPQCFLAPLAPHLAAEAEGKHLDLTLLRSGLDYWRACSDVILVEGAGGLMSPLGPEHFVADLAYELGFPLIVVARDALGTINHTLQTLTAARHFRDGLAVAGIVLNQSSPPSGQDPSTASNRQELIRRCAAPVLTQLAWQADRFDINLDWFALAR